METVDGLTRPEGWDTWEDVGHIAGVLVTSAI